MTYDNSNRLAVWPNKDRKQQTHPHLTGKGETNEPVYCSAWFSDEISPEDKKLLRAILKRYSSKKPFLSISIKSQSNQAGAPSQAGSQGFDDSDDIDF